MVRKTARPTKTATKASLDTTRVDGKVDAAFYPDIVDGVVACADKHLLVAFLSTRKDLAVLAGMRLMPHAVVRDNGKLRHPLGLPLPPARMLVAKQDQGEATAQQDHTTPGALQASAMAQLAKAQIRVLEFMEGGVNHFWEDPLGSEVVLGIVQHMPNLEVLRLHRFITWPEDEEGCPKPTTVVYAADILAPHFRYEFSRIKDESRIPSSVSTVVHQVSWESGKDVRAVAGNMFPETVQNFVLVFTPFHDGWYPSGCQPQNLKPLLEYYAFGVGQRIGLAGYTIPTMTIVDPPPSDHIFGPWKKGILEITFRRDALTAVLLAALQDRFGENVANDIVANVRVVSPEEYRADVGDETFLLHTAVAPKQCV